MAAQDAVERDVVIALQSAHWISILITLYWSSIRSTFFTQ